MTAARRALWFGLVPFLATLALGVALATWVGATEPPPTVARFDAWLGADATYRLYGCRTDCAAPTATWELAAEAACAGRCTVNLPSRPLAQLLVVGVVDGHVAVAGVRFLVTGPGTYYTPSPPGALELR